MNFANMSPADKMKASGLIGLIVVVLFFIVHTLLGAVAPKKPAAAGAATPAPGAPPPAVSQTAPAQPIQGEAFPKIAKAKTNHITEDALNLDPGDPFVPLKQPKEEQVTVHFPPPQKAVSNMAPDVEVKQLPSFNDFSATPSKELGALSSTRAPAEPATIAPIGPQIRLIGVIYGDNSLATIQVAGHTLTLRPGDLIARGYRLYSVEPDGIVVRHRREKLRLRVGAALNEPGEGKSL